MTPSGGERSAGLWSRVLARAAAGGRLSAFIALFRASGAAPASRDKRVKVARPTGMKGAPHRRHNVTPEEDYRTALLFDSPHEGCPLSDPVGATSRKRPGHLGRFLPPFSRNVAVRGKHHHEGDRAPFRPLGRLGARQERSSINSSSGHPSPVGGGPTKVGKGKQTNKTNNKHTPVAAGSLVCCVQDSSVVQ